MNSSNCSKNIVDLKSNITFLAQSFALHITFEHLIEFLYQKPHFKILIFALKADTLHQTL